jgi:N-acetylmuramoyl-L-alanine amidase
LGEEKALLAGGVREEDLRKEVLAEARKEPVPVPPPKGKPPAPAPPPKAEPKHPEKTPSAGQVYQVRKVVLDAGHGGHDSGARGYFKGYVEKQAALDITLKVRDFLKEKGFQVILTRDKDEFVTLENRTQVANRNKADLFVSIHCNANRKSSVTGTEIYTYNSKASNKLAAMSALRENAGGDYTDFILADLHHQGYVERSQFLAEKLAVRIREGLKQHYRSTQRGPFYVLGKADMPAVLVETAYISNKTEHAKIRDPYWRKKIAKAIADGIVEYREKVEKTLENHQARR